MIDHISITPQITSIGIVDESGSVRTVKVSATPGFTTTPDGTEVPILTAEITADFFNGSIRCTEHQWRALKAAMELTFSPPSVGQRT